MKAMHNHLPEQPEAEKDRDFTRLWIESQHVITGFISLHVHDFALVEDLVQEVASQASKNFDQYDPARPFAAWLIGIGRLRIVDMLRERGRRPVLLSSDTLDSLEAELIAMQPEVNERLEALRTCMSKLSDRQRRVVELRYIRHETSEDIAHRVGGSGAAVDSMLYRVRNALRKCISQHLEMNA